MLIVAAVDDKQGWTRLVQSLESLAVLFLQSGACSDQQIPGNQLAHTIDIEHIPHIRQRGFSKGIYSLSYIDITQGFLHRFRKRI